MGNISLVGATSGGTTLVPQATGTYTVTLPASSDTLATVSNPTFTGTVTATTVTSPSATALTIQSDGTTAMTVSTAQNVGIGYTTPGQKLVVNGNTQILGGSYLSLFESANNNKWQFQNNTNNLTFSFNSTEAMRIDSSGNLLVGRTTSPNGGTVKFAVAATASNYVGWLENTNASPYGLEVLYSGATPNNGTNNFLYLQDATTVRLYVTSNGGIGNYSANNTNLSDQRVKKDIQLAGTYLNKICAIPVKTFLYNDQTDEELNLGVIAQDVEAIAPELVDASGFGETPEDGIPMKAIYQTDLQYALMKCIQELSAKNDALEARLAALEAK